MSRLFPRPITRAQTDPAITATPPVRGLVVPTRPPGGHRESDRVLIKNTAAAIIEHGCRYQDRTCDFMRVFPDAVRSIVYSRLAGTTSRVAWARPGVTFRVGRTFPVGVWGQVVPQRAAGSGSIMRLRDRRSGTYSDLERLGCAGISIEFTLHGYGQVGEAAMGDIFGCAGIRGRGT